MDARLIEKLEAVKRQIGEFSRVIVAFSGGVDSTLLAALARGILGKDNVLAVTADSPSLAREDLEAAQRLAGQLDLRHLVIQTQEVENRSYRENNPSRCYFCKHELFEELASLATAQQIQVVLYGAIGDDQRAQRPGQRAAEEARVRAPLQEVGLTKGEVRELARMMELSNWNRPQNACLSSRIPHGQKVTEAKLRQVELAEQLLRSKGFLQVRVRHFGTHARIEVDQEDIARFDNPDLRCAILRQLTELGFATVGVDLTGYREGGANLGAPTELRLTLTPVEITVKL